MTLQPEDVDEAKSVHNIIYALLRSHNPSLSEEKKSHIANLGLIPEKRDEKQCKDLHEKILKGFELAKQGGELQELWIECEDNKVLKYTSKDASNSVVVINQKDISAARKNILELDYFCQRVEETDILRVDHVHILRQNLSYHHKRLKNVSFQFNQDTDTTNRKKLILTQLFPLSKTESKIEILEKR